MQAPRAISGHHFSDLLACSQRAWLHFFGDFRLQAKDPPYLRALQQEGYEHEREMYARWFPNAFDVGALPKAEQRAATEHAIRRGEAVILQAHLERPGAIGKVDVLELVSADAGSTSNHTYRVGEIKRSPILKTAHVLQAAWYAQLLHDLHGQTCSDAFFILGDGERQYVDLRVIQSEFRIRLQELSDMQANAPEPGPHLSTMCPGCHWRNICMPRLVASDHISLVPGVSRRQVESLQQLGISTWRDLATIPDSILESVGLDDYRTELIRSAVDNLTTGRPTIRTLIRPGALDNLTVVVAEIPDLARARRSGGRPRPTAIWYEADSQVKSIAVPPAGPADLSPLLTSQRLAVFGGTDLSSLRELTREVGVRLPPIFDLFRFIEADVHAPVLGLDLEALRSHAAGSAARERASVAADRVRATREVIDWIRSAL